MHCRNCDYPLWNLTNHACPECGDPFAPSEFEFRPSAVRFCCPHCEQEYYGTDLRGHLEPRAFNCVSCAEPIEMDSMILRPAAGVGDSETSRGNVPWITRSRGLFRSWLSTVGMSMAQPGKLMDGVPREGATGKAVGFFFATQLAIVALRLLMIVVIMAVVYLVTLGSDSSSSGAMQVMGAMGASLAGFVAFGLLVSIITGTFCWLLTCAVLRLGGPLPDGMSRTFQSFCYASGANIVSAVPCFGPWIGGIWWMVASVVSVQAGHRISGGRASLAVLVPPFVGALIVAGLYAWLIVTAVRSTGGMAFAAPGGVMTTEVDLVILDDAFQSYRQEQSDWPPHALLLVENGDADPYAFKGTQTSLSTAAIPLIDGCDLVDFPLRSLEERELVIDEMVACLGADVVAHRLGDFVFTYHCIDYENGGRELWICVLAPEPGKSKMMYGPQEWIALRLDGITERFAAGDSLTVEMQNELRALEGLPPLPPLDEVSQDRPGLAP